MGGIFGGGKSSDGGAGAAAAAQERSAAAARDAEQRRWEQEQKLRAEEKAEQARKEQEAERKRTADLEASKLEAEKQRAAAAATGGGLTFENTRTDQAKKLAGAVKEGGLPNFAQLQKQMNGLQPGQVPQTGYGGQGNSLAGPAAGFNQTQLGGRRYNP